MRVHRALCALAGLLLPALLPAQAPEPVCPLSDIQTQRAIDAFNALAPIFIEPRCFNCHGGVSPFGAGRNHPAESGFKIVRDPVTHIENVEQTFAPCQECHSGLPGWRLAPALPPGPNMQFGTTGAPKSPLQLCLQMKHLFPNQAGRFISHMTNDEGGTPFLNIAFEGTMALNKDGLDRAQHAEDIPDKTRIRIMTRAQMLQHANDWVQAQNEEFSDPDECGCQPLEYALRLRFHGVWTGNAGPETVRFEWGTPGPDAALPLVPIKFHEDGTVTGESTFTSPSTGNLFGPGSCAVAGHQSIRLIASGHWPRACTGVCDTGKIQVNVQASEIAAQDHAVCNLMGFVGSGSSNATGATVFTFPFQLDALVGATQVAPWNVPLPGFRGTVEATIVRIK